MYSIALVTLFIFSVVVLGLSGDLMKLFPKDSFPNAFLSSKMILVVFSATWGTLFSIVFFIGLLASGEGTLLGEIGVLHVIIHGVTFLVYLVAIAGLTQELNRGDLGRLPYDMIFKATEGTGWVVVVSSFVNLGIVLWSSMKDGPKMVMDPDTGKMVQTGH